MFQRLFLSALWSFLLCVTALGQDAVKELEAKLQQNFNDVATLVLLGKTFHDRGTAGDEDAVDKGFPYLDKALQLDPSNAVALAYRGSLWTLRGRDAWWPFTKMKHVEKGIDELDKAAEMAPDNVTVRIVRGINSLQLPSMFKRLPNALKDFAYLLAHPGFSHFDAELQSTIYCWGGIAYKQDNQIPKAKEYLQRAIAVASDSDTARKANEELKTLGETK
jgi:tetratricopeptide (TPR) repeat protein